MASGAFEDGVLNLCRHIEALAPGCRTGMCMARKDGTKLERAFFPTLPASFQTGIRDITMYPPYFGSCTAAMDGHQVITTTNMKEEERFDERFIEHCLNHSIVALQSRPVVDEEGHPFGTFVMGFSEPRKASDFDNTLMEFAADAAKELFKQERGESESKSAG
jgi:hypothetical protein